MYSYFAQFIPQDDGGYCVYFPDIDLATEGDTMVEAVFMAQDALRTHIEVCLEEKDQIPEPSDIQTVKHMAEKHCKELDIEITPNTSYQFIQMDITEKPLRGEYFLCPQDSHVH